MKLYHGSPNGEIKVFERRQANIGANLPEYETRHAIYLTKDFAFALLAGARPRGEGGGIRPPSDDAQSNQYLFNDPTKFKPEAVVYVYEWDTAELPEGSYEEYEDGQVVVNLDELSAHEPTSYPAEKIFEYYEFLNWPPQPTEHGSEFKFR